MAPIYAATFEAGNVTGTDGFSTSGPTSPTIDTTSKIKGANSARFNAASAVNIQANITGLSLSEAWVSFYMVWNSLVTASVRLLNCTDSASRGDLRPISGGKIELRNGSTLIGTSATTFVAGTLYRIGFHEKQGSTASSTDGVLELYIAQGDADFGAPEVTSSTQVTTNNAITQFSFGNTNSTATAVDFWIDDIRIDNAQFASPSIEWLHMIDPAFALKVQ